MKIDLFQLLSFVAFSVALGYFGNGIVANTLAYCVLFGLFMLESLRSYVVGKKEGSFL
jgi:hypothetical protein